MPMLTLPVSRYRRHALHYTLKSLGYLPTPLLERLNRSLNAPTMAQYPHADGHLRAIIGANRKMKRPLTVSQLTQMRKKFAVDAVSMQSPNVWQPQPSSTRIQAENPQAKSLQAKKTTSQQVHWQDKTIANADGGDMTIRCYRAGEKSNPDKVVMLFIHGGGFCIGDIDTHHEFCHTVCQQTGWAVASVDYRLAPEHPAPTALRDCLAAYLWLSEHCHTMGALPSRIVLSGDSAGGCLATLVAQQVISPDEAQWQQLEIHSVTDIQTVQRLPHPLAQLPLYPVIDITAEHPSWALYGEGLFLDHNDAEVFDAAYVGHSTISPEHGFVSVARGNSTNMCPSYIVAAELDILRDEALDYAEQLKAKGYLVKVHTVLGAPHGFIHLMSIHNGLNHEVNHIIGDFAKWVYTLCQTAD